MTRLESLTSTLRIGWVWAVRLFWIGLIASGAIFVLEAIHLFQLLAGIHPLLAWIVTGLLVSLVVGGVAWFSWRWWSVPRALSPPDLPPPESGWSRSQLKAYMRFARRYLARQAVNPAVDEESSAKVPRALAKLEALDLDLPAAELVRTVEDEVDRILEPLDRKTRQEVWQAASQVAALTAVNPSALLDVLITLLMNLDLMARLAALYGGRPGLLPSLRITRDVLATAVTAGLLDRIAEGASSVAAEMVGSWTTRLAGPVGQGIVNGLVTVRLGDAAVARCRSLRSRRVGIKPWSASTWREMARRLSGMVSRKLAPEVAAAFRKAGRKATEHGTGIFRRAWGWIRGADDDDPASEPPLLP